MTPDTADQVSDEVDQVLDVREIDGPPFDDIVATLEDLEGDERLRLVAPFEPVPLYEVLEERGFTHESCQKGEDNWHVRIEHE